MSMHALVTGSSGFLGRRFVEELKANGYDVAACDIADRPSWDALDLFRTDQYKYDLAIHCAAVSPWRLAIDGCPLQVGASNLELDAAYFSWAARAEPEHLVYISSSAAYPVSLQTGPGSIPLREDQIDLSVDTIGLPDASYGWTKITGEMLAGHYRAAGGRVTVVRPFSGYGEYQSSYFPFGAFRDRALRRVNPFEVWGSGQQVRDFIHVDDVVRGTLEAVRQQVAGPVNLATGVGTSLVELAEMFASEAEYRPEFLTKPDAPTGVAHRVGDSVLMRSFYRPRVSIEQGVARAVRTGVINAVG